MEDVLLMYVQQRQKRYILHHAMPVSYMGAGLPLNRPSGETVHFY
jgi:hypothetical protein